MLIATTIGLGPFKPALKNVFNNHTTWSIDHDFIKEDDAISYANKRLEIIEEAIRKALYSEGFQMVPGT